LSAKSSWIERVLTGGSIGSALTWNGVSDLPRPPDVEPVRRVTRTDRGVGVDDGGPMEPFRLMGVTWYVQLPSIRRTYG
jgi:hypothetical protein